MEVHRYEINFKGEIHLLRNQIFDYNLYDFEYGYSTLKFTGTEEEMNRFVNEIVSDEQLFKIIGIVNLSDTLVEITDAVDEYGYVTGEMLITDLYNNSKGYYLSREKTESLLDEKQIERLNQYNYNYPKRFYVRKKKLMEAVNNQSK